MRLSRRILCLYAPHLATDRVRRETGLPEEPLALTQRSGERVLVARSCVLARRQGIAPGLSLGEAMALLPSLCCVAHDPRADAELLDQLADWAVRFSPLVQPAPPDAILIDIAGCAELFGGERRLAVAALDGLHGQGIAARAAIADTVGAALALAQAGDEVGASTQEEVRVGSFHWAAPGETSAALAPLPPVSLRIAPRVAQRLFQLGLRTVGDLLVLPRSTLPARFGDELVLRLQQALGEVAEIVPSRCPQPPPEVQVRFEYAIRDAGALLRIAQDQLDRLTEQLSSEMLALQQLDCTLVCERRPPVVLHIGLSSATQAWKHVAELLHRRLETVDLDWDIVGLSLIAARTQRWRCEQADLFEVCEAHRRDGIGILIDTLANRVGHGALLSPALVDDFQPERAYRYVRVCDGRVLSWTAGRREPAAAEPVRAARAGRPTRLLPRPLPVRVIARVPDGPPTWFAVPGKAHVVAQAWGPERIETGWWRGPDVRRDYFRLATEPGEEYWVYRDADSGQWYLHGVFA